MGNAISISCNPINCTLNVDQEVRYLFCPARESEELRTGMAALRRSKEAIEKRIPELDGQPGVVIRDEVRGWIAAVDTLDRQVSALLRSLRRRSPCFRFLCCCSYPQNYALGQHVRNKFTETKNLKAEYDGWSGILVRPIEPLRSPKVAMGDELKKLEALRKDLETLAEEEIVKAGVRKQKSNALTVWSRKVDRLVSEVRGSINEQMVARVRKEIKDFIEEGEMIRNEGNLVIMKLPDKIPYLSVPDFLVGVEDDISKIFGFLKNDRTSVIGIHGMGGAGKTTLVKEMIKRLRSPEPQVEFDLVAFAVVSQTPNILKIQEEIGARLGYSWSSNTTNTTDSNTVEMERKEILRERLYGKKFLLILDDVWKELDLEKIGVPPLDSGTNSKVMLTTREFNVCNVMDCKEKLYVGKLGKEDSQKLFYRMCNKDDEFFKTEKEICKIADEILSKCGGLPLVIRTVARALANTSTVKDWGDAVRLFHRFPDSFAEEMETVFKLLKFSFDHLKRDEHRSCLLSFALYPEDEDIRIEEVIRYWIAEGLLEFTRCWKLEDLEACGRRLIIETLQNACLLEKGSDDDHVKMHDTIRDMAIWLGSEEGDYKNHRFFPYESWMEKNEQPVVDDKWKDVQRICFQGIKKVFISGGGISSAFLNLQTLIFSHAYLEEIPEELFTFTQNLRVLDLSWNDNLHSLPESVWSLKHLRYMDLSKTRLEQISEGIGCLTSLQFLYLKQTYIKQIPVEVGHLTNLVVLDLSFNKNDGIPYHALASLWKLQVLELRWTSLSSSDGGGMKELDINLVHLSSLSLTLQSLEDIEQLRECDVLKKAIWSLGINSVEKLTTADVSSVLLGLSSLKVLEIHNCWGLEGTLQLPGHSLQKLEKLELYELPLLSCLAVESECKLSNLVTLQIYFCDQLRDVRCLLQLPNLKRLGVSRCKGMVEVIPSVEEEATTTTEASSSSVQNIHQITSHHHYYFPTLQSIALGELPYLESISKVRLHLPSLELLRIKSCPTLRKLPAIESGKATVTIACQKKWWEELQWEEDAAHHLITPPHNFRCKF